MAGVEDAHEPAQPAAEPERGTSRQRAQDRAHHVGAPRFDGVLAHPA
jgi:hypothetical protein